MSRHGCKLTREKKNGGKTKQKSTLGKSVPNILNQCKKLGTEQLK